MPRLALEIEYIRYHIARISNAEISPAFNFFNLFFILDAQIIYLAIERLNHLVNVVGTQQ